MKVLHLINNLGSGGAEKLLVDLIPLMNKIENLQADILLNCPLSSRQVNKQIILYHV